MRVYERMKQPTPPFFKKIRNGGMMLAAAGAAILAAPVALPALVVQVAGFLAVAGSVATAVSQAATEPPKVPAAKRGKAKRK